MGPEQWKQIKKLYEAALEHPEADRVDFLRSACAEDTQVREEVESLVKARRRVGAFLEIAPAASPLSDDVTAQGGAALADSLLGSRIGVYTLQRVLGHGGMGTVYEAEQASPRRRVALKIIRGGGNVDEQVVKLFRREVQALALLNHPHIAALYEAGRTEDGRHYFAMELVPGIPLTDFARKNELPIERRLELFIKVCEAIAYAHQRGVIHRDIKPSNILVVEEGAETQEHEGTNGQPPSNASRGGAGPSCLRASPKVLDFGLAKITNSDVAVTTMISDAGKIQGTLAYMSPEQARGKSDEIDLRSDIYSLGVILFELLTGQLPYDVRSAPLPHAVRLICDEPPQRPSTINRMLRGDIETIALKALEKEPAQRYQSASELAADIRRFLTGQPITARPHSVVYQLRKMMWRHKLPFAFAATLLMLLIAFAVTMTVQSMRLTTQRDIARQAKDGETEQLWKSYLSQARALRSSGRVGQRFEALEILRKAAAIRPSIELRNEAIACLTLFDVRSERELMYAGSVPDLVRQYASFSFADGFDRYAVSNAQGNLSIRRVADDHELLELRRDRATLPSLSPDGRHLGACDDARGASVSNRLRLWRVDDQHLCGDWPEPIYKSSHMFSPDSRWLVSGHPGKIVRIRDSETGGEIRTIKTGVEPQFLSSSMGAALQPAGTLIAVGQWGVPAIEVWNIESGTRLTSIALGSPPSGPALSNDGRSLAVGGADLNVYVYHIASGKLRHVFRGHEWDGIRARFSRSDRILMTSAWDGTTLFWDLVTGRQLVRWNGGSGAVFSPDDRKILCFSELNRHIELRLLDFASPQECRLLADPAEGIGPDEVAVSNNERLLASTSEGGVNLWHVATGRHLAFLPAGHTRSAFLNPSCDALVTSGDRGLFRWPVIELSPRSSFAPTASDGSGTTLRIGPPQILYSNEPLSNAVQSTDGGIVAAGCKYRSVALVFEPSRSSEPRLIKANGDNPLLVALHPAGNLLATGGFGAAEIEVWSTRDGALLKTLECGSGLAGRDSLEFSSDGQCLLVNSSTAYSLWDCSSWQRMRYVQLGTTSFRVTPLIDPRSHQEIASLTKPIGYDGYARLLPRRPWLVQPNPVQHCIVLWDLRRVRASLAEIGLDWDAPPYPPLPTNFNEPIDVEVDLGILSPAVRTNGRQ